MNESDNPMQERCGAHCRTTGNPCLNFPMFNGRCRMHGGKSTGRPLKHGYFSAKAQQERNELNRLIESVHRHLPRPSKP